MIPDAFGRIVTVDEPEPLYTVVVTRGPIGPVAPVEPLAPV